MITEARRASTTPDSTHSFLHSQISLEIPLSPGTYTLPRVPSCSTYGLSVAN